MITRQAILDNSYRWPERSVPYSMSSYDTPTGHRADCSGYVSMCLGLPTPGLSTVTLANVCTWIDPANLLPGDIIGNLGPGTEGANGHVQLFVGWDGGGLAISEQAGGMYGPWRHTVGSIGYGYSAWRFNETIDDVITTDEPEDEMQAWIAQDQYSIVVVWLAPLSGLVYQNIGSGEAVAGWNAAGVPGPISVPNVGALGRDAATLGLSLTADQVGDPPAPDQGAQVEASDEVGASTG